MTSSGKPTAQELSDAHDVRVFLAPSEDLRREWKIQRDTTKRGYTRDEVLAELKCRQPDCDAFIRRQLGRADIIVSFRAGRHVERLDVELTLRAEASLSDLESIVMDSSDGVNIRLDEHGGARVLQILSDLDPDRGAAIEDAVWERMPFARRLHGERLGGFTIGERAHRSQSLAIVQVLILHQLLNATAAVAVGRRRRERGHMRRPEGRRARLISRSYWPAPSGRSARARFIDTYHGPGSTKSSKILRDG